MMSARNFWKIVGRLWLNSTYMYLLSRINFFFNFKGSLSSLQVLSNYNVYGWEVWDLKLVKKWNRKDISYKKHDLQDCKWDDLDLALCTYGSLRRYIGHYLTLKYWWTVGLWLTDWLTVTWKLLSWSTNIWQMVGQFLSGDMSYYMIGCIAHI